MLKTCIYRGLRPLLKLPVGGIFAKAAAASPAGDSGRRPRTAGSAGQDPGCSSSSTPAAGVSRCWRALALLAVGSASTG